jgi:3-methyladenine DNA glycosylase AlkD
MYKQLHHILKTIGQANPSKPERFFKTKAGCYGAHDKFLGVDAPSLRQLAKTYQTIDFTHLSILLHSIYNEERLLALFILLEKRQTTQQDLIVDFYLEHIHLVNNWNLVDASAHWIIGKFVFEKNDYDLLFDYAKEQSMWLRRIAIVATLFPIKHKVLTPTIEISQLLLQDKEDLIHKASGWMLRELGKRDQRMLEDFLAQHGKNMPRTMLRYAIERLDANTRKYWLNASRT